MLPAGWPAYVADPKRRLLPLLTVIWGGKRSLPHHLAIEPGALRACPGVDIEIAESPTANRVRPFWPWLTAAPTITKRWSPNRGQADVVTTVVDLLADAEIPEALRKQFDQPVGYGRLDLWADGATLASVLPLTAGRVEFLRSSRRDAGVRLRIVDGDVDRKMRVPPGKLLFDDFPDAPASVLGSASRVIIVGPLPGFVPCPQIDADGREFYIADHALTAPPSVVHVGADDYPYAFRVDTALTASTDTAYSRLVLSRPLKDLAFADRRVAVSGGVGILSDNPITDLLRLGGYELAPVTLAELRQLTRSFMPSLTAYVDAPTDVLSLVRDRLLPQAGAVLAWERDQVHLLRPLARTNSINLSVGTGLLFRIDISPDTTPVDEVANAIELSFDRSARDNRRQQRVSIDRHCGGTLGALLALSELRYGRRFLSLDAADLGDEADALALGRQYLRQHAMVHRRLGYVTEVGPFLSALRRNTEVILTDGDEQLSAVPTRVVEWSWSPSGPRVVLETTDTDVAAGTRT